MATPITSSMEPHIMASDAQKRRRRRRRRADKPAISAHLFLDDRIKDDVGTVSEDLFADLFPGYKHSGMSPLTLMGSSS